MKVIPIRLGEKLLQAKAYIDELPLGDSIEVYGSMIIASRVYSLAIIKHIEELVSRDMILTSSDASLLYTKMLYDVKSVLNLNTDIQNLSSQKYAEIINNLYILDAGFEDLQKEAFNSITEVLTLASSLDGSGIHLESNMTIDEDLILDITVDGRNFSLSKSILVENAMELIDNLNFTLYVFLGNLTVGDMILTSSGIDARIYGYLRLFEVDSTGGDFNTLEDLDNRILSTLDYNDKTPI